MKTMNIVSTIVLTCLSVYAGDSPVQKRGTDVLHYSVREPFAAEGGSDVRGGVYLTRKEQGNSQRQALDVVLKKLQPTNSYWLLSYPFGETNLDHTNITFATSFTSDARGNASLRYVTQGNGRSLGRGKQVLPDELNPVTSLGTLVVVDASTQGVAHADLMAPDKISYLVKRYLSTNEVAANLRIKANQNHATIKLSVAGLVGDDDYVLVLNGMAAETNAASSGRLVIDRRFDDPLEVIRLRNLSLYDTQTNVVLTTDLP
jgi:hypothetical protein